jgi:hypothetical protein
MLNKSHIVEAGYNNVEEVCKDVFLVKNYLDEADFNYFLSIVNTLSEDDWSASNEKFDLNWKNKFYVLNDFNFIQKIQAQTQQILNKAEDNLTVSAYGQIIRQYVGAEMNSHVDQHHFTQDGDMVESKYSLVLYLNDNYEGGELYFPDKNFEIRPPANSLLIFSGSKEEYRHGVKKVLEKNRYSVPGFAYLNWPNS